jgi:hypothetical protein
MIKVSILTLQVPQKRGFNDFYPLLKWCREFKNRSIFIKYFKNHLAKDIFDCDLLIIDYRYYQYIGKGKYTIAGFNSFQGEYFIIEFLINARKKGCKLILFDTGDSAGSATFHITPYVDVHLKKQLFKDWSYYREKKAYNLMPWLPAGLDESRHLVFTPIAPEDESKLKMGWNIGLCDFRWFPFKKKLPVGSSSLFNSFYKKLNVRKPESNRDYLLSYRGNSNKFESYDYQRNLLLEALQKLDRPDIVVGGKVPYKQYMREQRRSKITLSPFGWGEICYRDFEAFINGSLLVKPSVQHLVTFPAFFEEDVTYLPVNWDLTGLEMKIKGVSEDWLNIAQNGQQRFVHFQNSFQEFFNHIDQVILS